jgi:hypothetical protein
MERSQLMQEAVLHETARLGIDWTVDPVKPLEVSWPYVPNRKGPTKIRVSISVSLPVAELISRAAEHVHASEPLFIIGSTLAYIGRLQRCFRAIHTDTPVEAGQIRAALERIRLPSHYQYQRRTGR